MMCAACGMVLEFQSTHPLRGATFTAVDVAYFLKNFNPRTPCGVRPDGLDRLAYKRHGFQSTHPLRGATRSPASNRLRSIYFNPRTPCGVRRAFLLRRLTATVFQSTHPLRGATGSTLLSEVIQVFQSTHPLRGATMCAENSTMERKFQSTHPLRGATASWPCTATIPTFQSTHPLRGATSGIYKAYSWIKISIHAPLAGCDGAGNNRGSVDKLISIHAPLAGCDRGIASANSSLGRFQSTHPLRGATRLTEVLPTQQAFQSTHPLRGATC